MVGLEGWMKGHLVQGIRRLGRMDAAKHQSLGI